MAPSSSHAPNELQNTMVQEAIWFHGAFISTFFHGIQVTLSILAFFAVLRRRTLRQSRMRIVLLVYIAILFAIMVAVQGLLINWIKMGFITQRNYPGGPSAFLNTEWSVSTNLVGNVLVVLANWMMECLLVWRCRVVCNTGERCWKLGVVISLFLLIVVFVTGSLFIHQIFHATSTDTYILAYNASLFTLNITATGFIAGRLLVYRHRVVRHFGQGHGHHYVSMATIVVESAAVYSAFLLLVIVALVIDSPTTNFLQQVVVEVQAIMSLFIIWRIAHGKGWSESADTEMISVAIRPPSQPNVIQLDVLSMRAGEAEEGSIRQHKNERKLSFSKDGEV